MSEEPIDIFRDRIKKGSAYICGLDPLEDDDDLVDSGTTSITMGEAKALPGDRPSAYIGWDDNAQYLLVWRVVSAMDGRLRYDWAVITVLGDVAAILAAIEEAAG